LFFSDDVPKSCRGLNIVIIKLASTIQTISLVLSTADAKTEASIELTIVWNLIIRL